MADLERRRNEELARILHQLGWSPERLAREVGLALPPSLAISSTAPYKWRDRGMVPRSPHDQAVCEVLGRALGIAVTYEQLWGPMGSNRGAKILSPGLLTDPWTADTARTALRETATGAGPVRLTDLLRGAELDRATRHLASPPPAVDGGGGALRIAPEMPGDLLHSYRGKLRLARACGGGLVLGPARAELGMVAKLLELGSYDEKSGRELYGAASRLARLVGRAGDDLGHDAAAQRAFAAALRAAHLADEPRLAVAAAGGLLAQATRGPGGREPAAVGMLTALLAAAESAPEPLTPAERARQLGRIARAHGRRGEEAEAERAAGRALAAGAQGEGAALAEGLVGEAYLYLGAPLRARPLLAAAVDGLGPGRARVKALLMVRLADAHRRTGNRGEAARIADRARALAAGMQSERVAAALHDFDAAVRGRDGRGATG
ncbi:hypothetical protein ACWGB8_17230 [Kitasatospora sp. NPDC054939]